MNPHDNVTGVFLDADYERMIEIDLPLIQSETIARYKGEVVEDKTNEYGEIMFMGDLHLGHSAHSVNPFNNHLQFLADHPHIQLALMGDYIEYAAKSSYIRDETLSVDEQIDVLGRPDQPVQVEGDSPYDYIFDPFLFEGLEETQENFEIHLSFLQPAFGPARIERLDPT